MRVEDELRTAFGEIAGGPVPVSVGVPAVERAARVLRARRAAGAGAAALAVAVVAAAPFVLRPAGREPVADVPAVPPVNIVVAEEATRDDRERVGIALTPDGPVRWLGTRPGLTRLREVDGVVLALGGGRLVAVTPAGIRDFGAATSWAPARDGVTVWRAYDADGGARAQRMTTAGTPVGAPVPLPDGVDELMGEVQAGIVANVKRPAKPGDLPDDITYNPPRTHVTDVVLVPAAGGAPRVLVDNGSAWHVRGDFLVASPGDICNTRGSCGAYRLDTRDGTTVPLPHPDGTTLGFGWVLSPDAQLAATLRLHPGADDDETDTNVDPYDVWVRDLRTGELTLVENSRSVGTKGSLVWTQDGALTWIARHDRVSYVAWWRPGMAAARVGAAPLGRWYVVGGTVR